MTDHDRLFKELLQVFFVEFLDLFLPAVHTYVEPDSLVFLDKELFADVTSGERHEVDLVVQAQFRGQPSCFLIHVETQAQARADFGRRMFRYFARLYEKHGMPVYPVAVLSYDKPLVEAPGQHRVEFPDKMVLQFNYQVIQLNRLNWRDFVRHRNPVACALMAKMRIAPLERPKVKVECLRLLTTLRLDPARMTLIAGFVDTYLGLSAEEEQAFETELDMIDPAEKEGVMEVITSWEERGIQRGMQQGIQKGLQQGLRQGMEQGLEMGLRQGEIATVLRQLARRVGRLDVDIEARLSRLSRIDIASFSEALLDFSDQADVLRWLGGHEASASS